MVALDTRRVDALAQQEARPIVWEFEKRGIMWWCYAVVLKHGSVQASATAICKGTPQVALDDAIDQIVRSQRWKEPDYDERMERS